MNYRVGRRRPAILRVLPLAALVVAASCGSSDNSSDGDDDGGDAPPTETNAPGPSVTDPGSDGSSAPAVEGEPIKIGVIVSTTGNFANFGIGEEAAARLAAEQINAAGGVDGRPIELVIRDDAGAPDQAISVTRELIDRDNVAAIVGPGLTTTAEAAFPLANQAGVPTISPTIVSATAAPNNRPWTFTIGAPADILFSVNLPNISSEYPDVSRLVLVVDPECAGCANEAAFMAEYMAEQGYDVANLGDPIAISAGSPDLGAQATAIAGLDPDAIVGSAGPSEWARLAQELDRRGLDIPAFSGTGPSAPAFLAESGEAGHGWTVLSGFWAQNPAENVVNFVADMGPGLQAAGRAESVPIGADAQYFDAMHIVARAIEGAGFAADASTDDLRAGIRDGIQGLTDFTGVCGDMSMQENGRMLVIGYTLINVDAEWQRLSAN